MRNKPSHLLKKPYIAIGLKHKVTCKHSGGRRILTSGKMVQVFFDDNGQ